MRSAALASVRSGAVSERTSTNDKENAEGHRGQRRKHAVLRRRGLKCREPELTQLASGNCTDARRRWRYASELAGCPLVGEGEAHLIVGDLRDQLPQPLSQQADPGASTDGGLTRLNVLQWISMVAVESVRGLLPVATGGAAMARLTETSRSASCWSRVEPSRFSMPT